MCPASSGLVSLVKGGDLESLAEHLPRARGAVEGWLWIALGIPKTGRVCASFR